MTTVLKVGSVVWITLVFFSSGCGQNKDAGPPDTFNRGTIHISCDESFKPVIDAQVKVYEALYPETHIIVHYKPEADCIRDFLNDSIRMVIATRGFSEAEKRLIADSLQTTAEQMVIAHDLIAVIIHPMAKDSFFSMQEIKDLLTGRLKKNLIPVFDGLSATSTVRFMLDSVLKGASFGPHVTAAPSSRGVIDYVSRNPEAVGFVGYSWIGNSDDTAQQSYMKNVKTAWIESTDSANAYVHPSQFIIYTNSYPMIRDLVYVLKESHYGLGHAFAKFLYTMKGQLIFRRAYLMPVVLPNYVREAILQDSLTTNE